MKCRRHLYLKRPTIILHQLIAPIVFQVKRPAMHRTYPSDNKYPLLQHTGKTSLPLRNGQQLPLMIISHRNQAVSPFFISIAFAIIFI